MIGQKLHALTVLSEVRHPERRGRYYLCRCECGAEKTIYGAHLRNGSTKGCGCQRRLNARTHGATRSPEHRAWESAKARCHNPNNRKYPLYGGRGLRMADVWRDSFEAFYAEVGPRPSALHSLDRKDNDRGYEPGNVRWATATEQNLNRRQHRTKKMGVRRATSG